MVWEVSFQFNSSAFDRSRKEDGMFSVTLDPLTCHGEKRPPGSDVEESAAHRHYNQTNKEPMDDVTASYANPCICDAARDAALDLFVIGLSVADVHASLVHSGFQMTWTNEILHNLRFHL